MTELLLSATQRGALLDIRKLRADAIAHEILRAIRPFLSDDRDAERDATRAMQALLLKHGAEIVTDRVREDFGLPPRGPEGWTASELLAVEQIRLGMLLRPLPAMTLPAKPIATAWQPIETAPKEDDREILLLCSYGPQLGSWQASQHMDGGGWWMQSAECVTLLPTHWAPIPTHQKETAP
jgi:hypothetical protein